MHSVCCNFQVWHVKCDVHVLDHDGNLMDACALAALAALTVFRRPDVRIPNLVVPSCMLISSFEYWPTFHQVTIGGATGKEITVHPKEVCCRFGSQAYVIAI